MLCQFTPSQRTQMSTWKQLDEKLGFFGVDGFDDIVVVVREEEDASGGAGVGERLETSVAQRGQEVERSKAETLAEKTETCRRKGRQQN